MVKWTARMALGFSNTTPGIQLEPTNIRLIDDIICPAFDGLGKIPSEMQMSDGCGFANQLVMRSLQVKHRWPERYTAVQVRLGGMKGIIMEISDRPDDDPKVPLSGFVQSDPGNLIIDVVRPARLTSPARLSVETIINMSENGVPSSVFVNLMRSGMHKLVDMFVNWDQPGGLYLLWDSLRRDFGVIPSRLAREAAGAARARGYIREDRKDDSEQDDRSSEDPLQGRSTAWADDPVSGCPSSLVETIMQLLDAGFTPENCAVLSAKLKVQGTESLDRFCSDYHLPVEMSCSAVIIPDPYDVLGPGEVHVKSSHRNLVDQEGNYTDVIVGDVLVTRHPCKLPTDVQKVRAVFHEKLRNCLDVIVVSTKSYEYNGKPLNRHLASMTAGGDYDGDTWEVYWQPEVVEPFRNADPSYATVPDGVSKCLQKSKESVQEFLARIPMHASDETKILALQEYLLAGLRNASQVGSDDAVFLAHLFNTVLDGSKTGASVDKRIFSEHMAKYGKRGPEWAETEVQRNSCRNDIHLKRGAGLPSFVMDELFIIGHKEEKEKQAKRLIDAFVRPVIFSEELAAPWKDAVKRAAQFSETHGCDVMQEDLEKIKAHVEYVYQRSKDTLGSFYEKRSSGSQMGLNGKTASFTMLPIEVRQDTFRKLSMEFCSGPEVESYDRHTLERLRASYAYIYDYERNAHKIASKRWSRFPWDAAFRALCEINANAGALSRTVTQGFYSKMSVDRAFVKSLTKE
ncbi:RNA-dependent RNA polymerase 2 [Grifola frondosa]|uniref:RNA-dependent RNA polymerase n=1 Tax=Grifola frondosa TaxID=5627 RepID=A0A1C7MLF7_GRIFR|nr:RNA-dependent RNA polymerase 2 [Grifola frondosa]